MADKTGIQVSALFRNYLNRAGVDWQKCEEYGHEFDAQVEEAAWLSTDKGITFAQNNPIDWGGLRGVLLLARSGLYSNLYPEVAEALLAIDKLLDHPTPPPPAFWKEFKSDDKE